MRPILAILMDSIRQLRAKRLFWVVLALSGMIVVGYGSIGFNERGPTLFYGLLSIDQPMLAEESVWTKIFMEGLFSAIIVNVWLAWGAMILALVSTAGILPDFLAGGSIDLVLSKPIGRVKMFLTKYVGSLTFVFVQVLIFCTGVFSMLGWRMDQWEWKVFLAVPMVVLMFSYLYAIMALLNVWTKSALASLLVTMLLWFGIFSIKAANDRLQIARINFQTASEVYAKRSAEQQLILDESTSSAENEIKAARAMERIAELEKRVEETQVTLDKIRPFTNVSYALAFVLPKTGETVSLVQRWLEADSDLTFTDLILGNFGNGKNANGRRESNGGNRLGFINDWEIEKLTQKRAIDYENSQSEWWIIGSSLVFEAVILGFALFIFVRQDY